MHKPRRKLLMLCWRYTDTPPVEHEDKDLLDHNTLTAKQHILYDAYSAIALNFYAT